METTLAMKMQLLWPMRSRQTTTGFTNYRRMRKKNENTHTNKRNMQTNCHTSRKNFFPRIIYYFPSSANFPSPLLSMSKAGRRTKAECERDAAEDALHFPVDTHVPTVDLVVPIGLSFKAYEQSAAVAAAPALQQPAAHHGRMCVAFHCKCGERFSTKQAGNTAVFTVGRVGVAISKSQLFANRNLALSAKRHVCKHLIAAALSGRGETYNDEEEDDGEEYEDDENHTILLQKTREKQARLDHKRKSQHPSQPPPAKRTATSKVDAVMSLMLDMRTLPKIKGMAQQQQQEKFAVTDSNIILYLGTTVPTDPRTLLPAGAIVEWQRSIQLTANREVAVSFTELNDDQQGIAQGLVLEIHGGRAIRVGISTHADLALYTLELGTRFQVTTTQTDTEEYIHMVLRALAPTTKQMQPPKRSSISPSTRSRIDPSASFDSVPTLSKYKYNYTPNQPPTAASIVVVEDDDSDSDGNVDMLVDIIATTSKLNSEAHIKLDPDIEFQSSLQPQAHPQVQFQLQPQSQPQPQFQFQFQPQAHPHPQSPPQTQSQPQAQSQSLPNITTTAAVAPQCLLWIDLDQPLASDKDPEVFTRVHCHLMERNKQVVCRRVQGTDAAILWLTNATPDERATTVIVAVEKQASTAPQDLFRIIGMMGLARLPAYLLTLTPPIFARAPVHAQCIASEADLVAHLLRRLR
jgi:hypothetical protein